jgi:hypothetical protein
MSLLDKRDKEIQQYRSSATATLPHPEVTSEGGPSLSEDYDTAQPILILARIVQESQRSVKSRDWVASVADPALPAALMLAIIVCMAFPGHVNDWLGSALGKKAVTGQSSIAPPATLPKPQLGRP